ncbi:bifunctional acetate--CoA ligase family protein/GNAT family N-acetyltransferase [Phytohalomonas tamaricis]|uniref:bifunctional acetate--CoA ligase family protein/GNAT family N-acetyltransferase n=1 Tax=Phytohalomonas tamaricis TaxID=2081032 RepID=UPI000D0B1ED9|nr:bifunctional acetate--CoA ligase family protein/GNAT family N-acetyltransferase [Phytohalomonas tamaricis]
MGTRFLHHFFEPRSIVVIGGSEKPHSMGGMVIRNLIDGGFSGQLWSVNPNDYDAVHGCQNVQTIEALPAKPDLAILCTPLEVIAETILQLGQFGVQAAMVLSGGAQLNDDDSEHSLRRRLMQAAITSGVRVLGPECLGVAVPGRKLNATYASQPLKAGKVAYLGQSGMLGNAMIDWAAGRGIGFSHVVTLGDSIDVMLPDVIDYINQYAPSRAILLHLERIHDAMHFMTALREASRNRLVLAIKSGRTPQSDISGEQPTPGIANRDRVYDAAFARAGVVRVDNSDELYDGLETLTRMRPLRGSNRLAIISNGLGPALLAIDKLISSGGRLAEFSEATRAILVEHDYDMSLPGRNPVDLGGAATPERFVEALRIVAADDNVDAVLVVHAPTRMAPSKVTAEAIIAHRKEIKRNLLTSWMGLEEALSARHECNLAGIPTYLTPEKAVKAFMLMVDYQRVQALLQETPPTLSFATNADIRKRCHALIEDAKRRQRDRLTHEETGFVLNAYGIDTAQSRYVKTPEEGAAVADQIHGSKALKIVHESNSLPYQYRAQPHQLTAGVLQDLDTPEDVANGIKHLQSETRHQHPDSQIYSYCIQPMQRGKQSLQLCAGITRDAVFGPLIVFGLGGYKVDVMRDRQVALPPLNMTLARNLVMHSHAYSLIEEHSREPEDDIARICQLLVKLSQMSSDLPELKGIEINPLVLNRDSLMAVDFAMDLGTPARFAIMPYPEELREWITLENGMHVEVRPIRGEDAPLISDFHTYLSEQSIRFRYFHHKAELTRSDLALLTQINYDRQMAFIAEHTDAQGKREMLGVVRVWNDPDNIRTEFSVIIRDDLQGQGIGKVLMEKLIRYCRGIGTLEMIGKVMMDNLSMRALISHLGFSSRNNMEEQVVDVSLRLNEPTTQWQRLRLESQS